MNRRHGLAHSTLDEARTWPWFATMLEAGDGETMCMLLWDKVDSYKR